MVMSACSYCYIVMVNPGQYWAMLIGGFNQIKFQFNPYLGLLPHEFFGW